MKPSSNAASTHHGSRQSFVEGYFAAMSSSKKKAPDNNRVGKLLLNLDGVNPGHPPVGYEPAGEEEESLG
jgi:hypothetical protein